MILSDLYIRLKKSVSDFEARLMIEHRAGYTWSDIIAHPDSRIEESKIQIIESDLARRKAGEPLSRIYGRREFWSLEFELSPDTLDPRPDTEVLIECALAMFEGKNPPRRILDLGTGTGCILIALLHEWKDSTGVGIDKSPGAVETARRNAKRNGVESRAAFLCGDWGDGVSEKFDLVVSNPPYIVSSVIPTLDKEVRNHDPILALDGGENGLDAYKKIFSQLYSLLNPSGAALFEIGYDQEESITRLAEDSRIRITRIHRDTADLPRVVEISSGDK